MARASRWLPLPAICDERVGRSDDRPCFSLNPGTQSAPRSIDLAANFASRILAGMDIHIGIAILNRLDQSAERLAGKRPNQVGLRDDALSQHALKSARN